MSFVSGGEKESESVLPPSKVHAENGNSKNNKIRILIW